jgi:hypothetical protein
LHRLPKNQDTSTMPTPYVKKIAADTGMSVASVEAKWDEAKASAHKQYPGLEKKDSSRFYAIVTSILKKMTHEDKKEESAPIKPISEILADIKAGKISAAEATEALANDLVERGMKPYAAEPFKAWGKPGYERTKATLLPGGKTKDIKEPKALKESEEIVESEEEDGRAAGKALAKQAHPSVVNVKHGDGTSDDVKIKVLHNGASDTEKAAFHATAADHFKKQPGQASLLKYKAHKQELGKLMRKHSDAPMINMGYSYAYDPMPSDAHPDVKAGIHACKFAHGLHKDVVESVEEEVEANTVCEANVKEIKDHLDKVGTNISVVNRPKHPGVSVMHPDETTARAAHATVKSKGYTVGEVHKIGSMFRFHAAKAGMGNPMKQNESVEQIDEVAKPYANPAFARTHNRVYNKLVGLYVPDFKEKVEAATKPTLMPEALLNSMKESADKMGHAYIFEDMGLEPRDIIIVTTADGMKAVRVGDMVEMAKGADVEAVCKILEKQVKEPCAVYSTGVDAGLTKLLALTPNK